MKKAIIITGPTATHKTSYALKLAQLYKPKKAVIINADSLLFYKNLNIGTAKPTKEERADIPHYLIDIAEIQEPINAKGYSDLASEILYDLEKTDITPFIVGGSPFYLRALLKGLYGEQQQTSEMVAKDVKKHLENIYQNHGIDAIREKLQIYDPESYHNLHTNDHYRNMRALEYYLLFNEKISSQKKGASDFDLTIHKFKNYEFLHIHLDIPKEQHFKIIQERTRHMVVNDLKLSDGENIIDEMKNLLKMGYTGMERPLKSVGYKEVKLYLDGKIKSYEELMERINIATRQLAKAQRTFFKKIGPKIEFNPLTQNADIELLFTNFLNESL